MKPASYYVEHRLERLAYQKGYHKDLVSTPEGRKAVTTYNRHYARKRAVHREREELISTTTVKPLQQSKRMVITNNTEGVWLSFNDFN